MRVNHNGTSHQSFVSHLGHTFRHLNMWTIPLVMSLICAVWGLVSLLLGQVDGPGMMSRMDATLMLVVGSLCFCYVLVGDYLHDLSRSWRPRDDA